MDPVTADGNTGGNFNRYWYANNNPYKFTDPDGRAVTPTADGQNYHVDTFSDLPEYLIRRVLNDAVDIAGILLPNIQRSESGGDLPTGDDIKFDDKIKGDLGKRGWTEEGAREATKGEPTGTTTDNTYGKTGDKGEPATVYGPKEGGNVIVNDKTGVVVQVTPKDGAWAPDDRIKWKEDPPNGAK